MLLLYYPWAGTEVTVLETPLIQLMKFSFYALGLISNLETITKTQLNFQMKLVTIIYVKICEQSQSHVDIA